MKCIERNGRSRWFKDRHLSHIRLVVLLAAFVLSGCKKDDGRPTPGASSETQVKSEAATATAASGAMESNPKQAGSEPSGESAASGDSTSAAPLAGEPAVIPDIRLDQFEPVIQTQLTQAIDAVNSAPKSAEAVGSLAMLLDSYNLRHEACKLYQSASGLDPNDFRWAYLGGRLLFFEGDGTQAVLFLTRASELKPDDIACQIALINALIKVERLQDAGERAATLLEKHPNHPLANYLLGSINLKLKAPVFALQYLKPVFVQYPDLGGVRRDVAATLDMLGQKENAEKVRAVEVGNNRIPTIEDPHHEAVLKLAIGTNVENERGAFALLRGDAEGAKTHFSNAIRHSPGDVAARVGLADAHLRLGEFDESETVLRPLIKGEKESLAGTVLLAKLRIAQKRFDEVEELIEKAVKLGAEPDHILKLRFSLAEGQKDLPKIVELLEQLVKEEPGSADNHYDLANALVFSDRYEDAEKEYAKALELNPRHAGAMQGMGALYTSRGESQAARTWYLKAFELGGTAPRTLSWAGRDALDKGDYQRGLAILSQAYAAYPTNTDLGDMLSRTYSMCPDANIRDWEKALRIAVTIYGDDEDTMPLTGLHTLAAAHAEADNFDEAARLMEVGVQRASEGNNPNNILQFSKSKRQYAAGKHLYDPEVVPSEYK